MILGRIIGKTTTNNFKFKVDDAINSRKFDFVQVMYSSYGYVLSQIVEIEREKDSTVAYCNIIGYKEKDNIIRPIRTPFEPGSEVLIAEDQFIKKIIEHDSTETAFIGTLEGKEKIKVNLDLKKLLTKHLAVLAKTGAGKSYVTGVLVEEIIEKKVPLLIIDPHGEYSQLKQPNDDKNDVELLKSAGLKPRGYKAQIQEYGDIDIVESVKPLLLNEEMTPRELLTIMPAKMSMSQQAALYSVMKDVKKLTLSEVILELEKLDSNHKYNIINMIDYIKNLNIFSLNYTLYNELINTGKCSIINLKGVDPEIQDIAVYKLLKDLFEMRKTNKIAPFFCVIEEAHNFVPERSSGERKSSNIIRTIASEGRKFGLGLCVITQRPARIEKNVLSQCNTQIILKVTNPNDLKAIVSSVEGITSQSEREIQNLPIGTAIVTGLSDMPFFVKIRPRKSKHGGKTIEILKPDMNIIDETKRFENKEILPIIDSKFSIKEIKLMNENKKEIMTYLIPAVVFTLKDDSEYNILVDRVKGNIIADIAKKEIVRIEDANKIEEYRTFEKVEFKRVIFNKKLDPKVKIETIKKKLELFVDIVDYKECYVVYHYAK